MKYISSNNCQNFFSWTRHLYDEIQSYNCISTNWPDTISNAKIFSLKNIHMKGDESIFYFVSNLSVLI